MWAGEEEAEGQGDKVKSKARIGLAVVVGVGLALAVAAEPVGMKITRANRELVEVRTMAPCGYTVWVTHAARWDGCVKPAGSVISGTDFLTLTVYWSAIGEEPVGWRTACVWWACGNRGGLVRRGLGQVFLPLVLAEEELVRPTVPAPTKPRPTPTLERELDELPELVP